MTTKSVTVLMVIDPQTKRRKTRLFPKRTWGDCLQKGVEAYEATMLRKSTTKIVKKTEV
jgi:hypothetical protein